LSFPLILTRLPFKEAQIDYEKSKERQLRIANNQLTEERHALERERAIASKPAQGSGG
jgi:hypothetical protein